MSEPTRQGILLDGIGRPPGASRAGSSERCRDRGSPLRAERFVAARHRGRGPSERILASACEPCGARAEVSLRALGMSPGPGALSRRERDAIDGTGRQAERATGAPIGEHGMHQLRSADDRVDRTRVDAQGAADADGFVYARENGCFGEVCVHPGILPLPRRAVARVDGQRERDERSPPRTL